MKKGTAEVQTILRQKSRNIQQGGATRKKRGGRSCFDTVQRWRPENNLVVCGRVVDTVNITNKV